MVQGWSGTKTNFDQGTEDIKLYLSHKAAKDFLIREGLEVWTPADVKEKVFGKEKGTIQPQSENQNRLLAYTSSILNYMYEYVIGKIKSENLTFDILDINETESLKYNQRVEVRVYFLFKLAFENDKRYGVERIERFDDFSEFLPVTPK